MPGDLLTIAEVAELAGIKPRSVVQLRWRGAMPEPDGWLLGRHPVWTRATIDAWLASRRGWGPGRPRDEGVRHVQHHAHIERTSTGSYYAWCSTCDWVSPKRVAEPDIYDRARHHEASSRGGGSS